MAANQGDAHLRRRDVGGALLDAARALDTRPVSSRLSAFRKAHAALVRSLGTVAALEAKLVSAQCAVAETELRVDDAIERLAAALITIGQPRINAFRSLSRFAPSRMKALGYRAEATALAELSAKARKMRGLNAEVLAAAREADRAAHASHEALASVERAEARWLTARARRDALAQPWETALAALRRVARESDATLYESLFRSARRPKSVPPKTLDGVNAQA